MDVKRYFAARVVVGRRPLRCHEDRGARVPAEQQRLLRYALVVEEGPADGRLRVVEAEHGEPPGRAELEPSQRFYLRSHEPGLVSLRGIAPCLEARVLGRRYEIVENFLLHATVLCQVVPVDLRPAFGLHEGGGARHGLRPSSPTNRPAAGHAAMARRKVDHRPWYQPK